MLPPNKLWMLAPMLPTIDRDRTMIPRTTPNDLVTRQPGRSKAVVVRGWVWLINRGPIEHETAFKQKRNLSAASTRGASVSRGEPSKWGKGNGDPLPHQFRVA